jgi:hypothetical protein
MSVVGESESPYKIKDIVNNNNTLLLDLLNRNRYDYQTPFESWAMLWLSSITDLADIVISTSISANVEPNRPTFPLPTNTLPLIDKAICCMPW